MFEEWGNIVFSDNFPDIEIILRNKGKVIVLADDPTPYAHIPGVLVMSILLPPAAAIYAELDNNKILAEAVYRQHLQSDSALRALAGILTALLARVDIMIYIDRDESMSFEFAQVFASAFHEMFGIHIGSMAAPSTMGPTPIQVAQMANIMFGFNFIPFEMYCVLMPTNMVPSDLVMTKIIGSSPYRFNTAGDAATYAMRLIAATKNLMIRRREAPAGQPAKQGVMFLNSDADKLISAGEAK